MIYAAHLLKCGLDSECNTFDSNMVFDKIHRDNYHCEFQLLIMVYTVEFTNMQNVLIFITLIYNILTSNDIFDKNLDTFLVGIYTDISLVNCLRVCPSRFCFFFFFFLVA